MTAQQHEAGLLAGLALVQGGLLDPFGEVDASPTVARGYVYFATNTPDGIIGSVGVSGNVVGTLRTGDPVFASPVVADGRLFVVTTNGTVLCLGRPPEPRVGAKLSVRENARPPVELPACGARGRLWSGDSSR